MILHSKSTCCLQDYRAKTFEKDTHFLHILYFRNSHLLPLEKEIFCSKKSLVLSIKSQTCGEGGAHLRNSFWHLLMNLKNKLFQKTIEVGQYKQNNFDIYNVAFF